MAGKQIRFTLSPHQDEVVRKYCASIGITTMEFFRIVATHPKEAFVAIQQSYLKPPKE